MYVHVHVYTVYMYNVDVEITYTSSCGEACGVHCWCAWGYTTAAISIDKASLFTLLAV